MPKQNFTMATPAKNPAYQRPYKSRNGRRKEDRRRFDDNKDSKFFWRVVMGVVFLLLLVLGFVVKGTIDRQNSIPASQTPVQEIF